jgi:hypothetical protein
VFFALVRDSCLEFGNLFKDAERKSGLMICHYSSQQTTCQHTWTGSARKWRNMSLLLGGRCFN